MPSPLKIAHHYFTLSINGGLYTLIAQDLPTIRVRIQRDNSSRREVIDLYLFLFLALVNSLMPPSPPPSCFKCLPNIRQYKISTVSPALKSTRHIKIHQEAKWGLSLNDVQ